MVFSDIPGIDKPVSRLVQGTMWINTGNLDAAFAAFWTPFTRPAATA